MQLHYSTALEGARAPSLVQSQLFDYQDISYDDLTFAAVLPEQFYSSVIPSVQQSGHLALRWAVLADALNCLIKKSKKDGRREQRLTKETAEWVFTDDVDWPFSFVNICAALRIDPAYIRRGLLRWMRRGTSERSRRLAHEEVVVSLPQRAKPVEALLAHSTLTVGPQAQATPTQRAQRPSEVALST